MNTEHKSAPVDYPVLRRMAQGFHGDTREDRTDAAKEALAELEARIAAARSTS